MWNCANEGRRGVERRLRTNLVYNVRHMSHVTHTHPQMVEPTASEEAEALHPKLKLHRKRPLFLIMRVRALKPHT